MHKIPGAVYTDVLVFFPFSVRFCKTCNLYQCFINQALVIVTSTTSRYAQEKMKYKYIVSIIQSKEVSCKLVPQHIKKNDLESLKLMSVCQESQWYTYRISEVEISMQTHLQFSEKQWVTSSVYNYWSYIYPLVFLPSWNLNDNMIILYIFVLCIVLKHITKQMKLPFEQLVLYLK